MTFTNEKAEIRAHEIEKTKAEIQVLTKKLSFLEDMQKRQKSPAEEAYKRWWGEYPGTETWTIYDETRWVGFQKGYADAYGEKVSQEPEEEPEKLKTLYQMFYDEKWCKSGCDEFCDVVKRWMSQYTHNVMTGEYLKGYEECLTVLEENLK